MRRAISSSSTYDGWSTTICIRKRSRCASGSAYTPSDSIGFCVASTRNGFGVALRLSRDRHVPLGHDLEQRRLHLGGRAVDLVGEHEVREHRAPLDVELLARRAPDARADDVGGNEVGRELEPGERAADDAAPASRRSASSPVPARPRSGSGRGRAGRSSPARPSGPGRRSPASPRTGPPRGARRGACCRRSGWPGRDRSCRGLLRRWSGSESSSGRGRDTRMTGESEKQVRTTVRLAEGPR